MNRPQASTKNVRDWILFTAGLLGIAWETVVQQSDRPTLLILFASMVGLPAFLKTDEKNKEKDQGTPTPNPPVNPPDDR